MRCVVSTSNYINVVCIVLEDAVLETESKLVEGRTG